MLKNIEGIIVSTTDFNETSRIVNILTPDGLISGIAKGARSLKSPLRSFTLKFTYANFQLYYKENKISIIKSADVINNFTNIKSDLISTSYMTYLIDLATQIIRQNNDVNIYKLLIQSLEKLETSLNPQVITNIFEIKVLEYLGVGINFNTCIKCGSTHNIITIDADEGGYICQECYTNEIIYDDKTLKMLRMYYLVDIPSIKDLKISDTVSSNINCFLNMYYDRYTGLYLKSKKFLESLL